MIVSLESGEIADIVRVEFPEWAKLSDSSITDGSIRLKAIDLGDMVRPGATNIVLATIIFGNTKQGESLIELTVVRMDNGNPITPSIEPGRLMVMGPPTQTATTTQITAGATPPTITIYVSKTITETITTTIESLVKLSGQAKEWFEKSCCSVEADRGLSREEIERIIGEMGGSLSRSSALRRLR